MAQSNREKGAESLRRLATWLAAAPSIPERNGKANISAIAVATGLDRQVLYRDEAREMIRAAVAEKGLGMPDLVRTKGEEISAKAQRRIHQLEQQLANARAEVAGLRERLQAYEHIEAQMLRSGLLPR